MTTPDPHLFIATDPWGDTSLWFGTGPTDPRPELVQFNCSRAAEKALWRVLAASPQVPIEDPHKEGAGL